MKEHKALYLYGLRVLTRREYSAKSLLKKLKARAEDDTASAEAVLLRLQEEGWQSDVRFAESYTRYRSHAGFGPVHIKMHLKQEGLDECTLEAGFEAAEIEWLNVLTRVCERKFRARPDSPKDLQKRFHFLQMRGFSWDLINQLRDLELLSLA